MTRRILSRGRAPASIFLATFLLAAFLAASLSSLPAPAAEPRLATSHQSSAYQSTPYQSTGVKVGEVTDASAIVWARLTAEPARGAGEGGERRFPRILPEGTDVASLEGACPGAPGRARVRWGTREDLEASEETAWVDLVAESDFAASFRLEGLRPATLYHYAVETIGVGCEARHGPLRGSFTTAPPPERAARVAFTVVTGQAYRDLDSPEGFRIYGSMLRLDPDFHVLTGDTVYYDNDPPLARTPELARYHWHRMYSLPLLREFHRRVPAYWMKDDHDVLFDDCWPGMDPPAIRPMTFAEGQRIFLQEVPMGPLTYRKARWGRLLEVWFLEGRDFRSPNPAPDGPAKTILGAEQKDWLQRTVGESGARWKVIVSATPLVGPDRAKKADNHANAAFAREGEELRRSLGGRRVGGGSVGGRGGDTFVVCGDRHWQYHSVDPESGLEEFSCGPASDAHAGGSPGEDPLFHRFHREQGGFLSVTVEPRAKGSALLFRFHDVDGAVVYERSYLERRA